MRKPRQSPTGLGLVLKAAQFAAHKHRLQRRKDAKSTPYINHPLALAAVLWEEGGVRDPIVIAAALVKLADKICNLRDMLASPPSG